MGIRRRKLSVTVDELAEALETLDEIENVFHRLQRAMARADDSFPVSVGSIYSDSCEHMGRIYQLIDEYRVRLKRIEPVDGDSEGW